MKEKIIIFGASQYGEIAYALLKEQYEIVGFADNSRQKQGTLFHGYNIYSPEEILQSGDVKVIIASQYYSDIGRQLQGMGAEQVFVFFYRGNPAPASHYERSYKLVPFTEKDFFQKVEVKGAKTEEIRPHFGCVDVKTAQGKKRPANPKARKKVLVCAYHFPPQGGGGVQRPLKFVKYLREFGYEPVVLTAGESFDFFHRDPAMLKELPEDIEIIRFDDELVSVLELTPQEQQEILNLYAGTGVGEDWIETWLQWVTRRPVDYSEVLLLPEITICWANHVLKHIEERLDLNTIDLVLTTAGPYADIFIGYYIKQKYNIPWMIDYRDEWTSNEVLSKRRHVYGDELFALARKLEKALDDAADHIIVVAEGMKKEMEENLQQATAKLTVIANGYDEDDFAGIRPEKSREQFCLCYNGSIYDWDDRFDETRNYTVVLKALNRLIAGGKADKAQIRWMITGNVGAEAKRKLDSEDTYHLIQYNGYLAHRASLQRAAGAHLLVHLGCYDELTKSGYGGKTYEYLRLKTPILYLSKPGGVYDELAAQLNNGENFDYSDEAGISEFIFREYAAWREGKSKFAIDEEKIAGYERKNLTRELARIFDNYFYDGGKIEN